MAYDLRKEVWIPLRRASGAVEWCAPFDLTSRFDDDPVIAVASPRPDFDAALTEFLIGLLAAAFEPRDEEAWYALWQHPPTPADLERALAAMPPAFDLIADGPAFLQDLDVSALGEAKQSSLHQLLIDAPGDKTKSENKDHFVKRAAEDAQRFSLPAAAMALLTLQSFAPSGGAGHRVSLRGGGPLTTIVDPRSALRDKVPHAEAVWYLLWANVPTTALLARRPFAGTTEAPAARYPWLAATRTSRNDRATQPQDGDALQAFFGMPRRIRLVVSSEAGRCELTGVESDVVVTGYRSLNYGVKYENWWHPLTPYYRIKGSEPWLSEHGKPRGHGWRDWLGIIAGDGGVLRLPAAVVSHFSLERARRLGLSRADVLAFGYDLDQMKARSWTSSRLPVYAVTGDHQHALNDLAARLVGGTDAAASELEYRVRDARYGADRESSGGDTGARLRLWDTLESAFYRSLDEVVTVADPLDSVTTLTQEFHRQLCASAIAIFDELAPPNPADARVMRRTVTARHRLTAALFGRGAGARRICGAFGLELPTFELPQSSSRSTETSGVESMT